MINKKYNEFLPSVQSAEELVSQVEGLCSNIDLLKAGIETEVTARALGRVLSLSAQTRAHSPPDTHLGALTGDLAKYPE